MNSDIVKESIREAVGFELTIIGVTLVVLATKDIYNGMNNVLDTLDFKIEELKDKRELKRFERFDRYMSNRQNKEGS